MSSSSTSTLTAPRTSTSSTFDRHQLRHRAGITPAGPLGSAELSYATASFFLYVSVGTPGLGYPLLLCRGKGLVVILDYVQTAGPLRSGVLFPRQRSRTCLTAGKGPGTPRVPEEAGEQPGLRTSRGVRTPAEVPDPS